MPSIAPGLWVVATPLGNPEDLSPRARNILQEANLVLAEDTRRAAFLFRQCDIHAKNLTSFYDHNEITQIPSIMEKLAKGERIALISDAGTPLLSDPGFRLVKSCRQANIPVHPVPGPSAPVAALSAAGLPPIPFSFLGFLPRSHGEKKKIFQAFKNVPGSIVFFERKDRLKPALNAALNILGNREVMICREMTKTYEEFLAGSLRKYAQECPELLGELTIIIAPAQEYEKLTEEKVRMLLKSALHTGKKLKEAIKAIAPECYGWTSSEIYQFACKTLQDDL